MLSPQARVRASIKAHNVVINGDYEGNVDSGGRFEIGSTGRVKGEIKTQVLVIKEGAFFEGTVAMTRKPPPEGTGGATVRIERRVELQARRPRPAADRPPLPAKSAAAARVDGQHLLERGDRRADTRRRRQQPAAHRPGDAD